VAPRSLLSANASIYALTVNANFLTPTLIDRVVRNHSALDCPAPRNRCRRGGDRRNPWYFELDGDAASRSVAQRFSHAWQQPVDEANRVCVTQHLRM
jgi:hypothetical protein